MDFVSLISDLGPMELLKRIGLIIMHGVFVLLLVRQVIRFLQHGQADFFTPLLHYCISLLCIVYLPDIGKVLVQVTRDVSTVLYEDQNITDFLASETEHYVDSEDSPLVALANFLNGKTYQRMIARASIMLMLVIKIVLIDIIWQIFFAMTTMLGAISIPIALMFGSNALRTWFRQLLELMLWPIIYSLLMLTMNAIIMDPNAFLLSYDVEADLKRICASWAIMFLTIVTPFLARAVMRIDVPEDAASRVVRTAVAVAAIGSTAVRNVAASGRRKARAAGRLRGDARTSLNKR